MYPDIVDLIMYVSIKSKCKSIYFTVKLQYTHASNFSNSFCKTASDNFHSFSNKFFYSVDDSTNDSCQHCSMLALSLQRK